ncbi:hypothetical protein [Escherichia albertii]|uniref:hypothetical protein n=1 Tax=Escherichia albertii TaxID=208962 RepID=UPI001130E11E|nr:hypothetical protein [Escherichia albertii]
MGLKNYFTVLIYRASPAFAQFSPIVVGRKSGGSICFGVTSSAPTMDAPRFLTTYRNNIGRMLASLHHGTTSSTIFTPLVVHIPQGVLGSSAKYQSRAANRPSTVCAACCYDNTQESKICASV